MSGPDSLPLTALLLLALLAPQAPGLSWQENLRPKLFCSMTPRDYTAFVGNLSAEDRFTGLLYTDFTAEAESASSSASEGPSINTPYSTLAPEGGGMGEEEGAASSSSSSSLLLIGARNIVYKLSASELRLTQTLHWPADESATDTCMVKGKTEDACQNFIVVMQQYDSDPTRFMFCGTNAFSPTCRDYADERASFVNRGERRGIGLAPFDPEHNSTAVLVGEDLYAGTVADFAGVDSIVFRKPLRTQQYDSTQLNSPDFVGSFSHENFVYFFFREAAVEYINCGKTVFSRVARVCKNDQGGPHKSRHSWTSFLKTRLNCSVPGEFPFYFDEIQGISQLVRGRYGAQRSRRNSEEELIYATFTTPPNSIGGSAVCAFRMRDISDAFAGRFKEQRSMSANWLPVEQHKVPVPRPGTCINDTKSLSDQNLNFIKTHSLMDETVLPFFGAPLVVRSGLTSRFTVVAVDPQVRTTSGDAYDVIFIGTSGGHVIKVLNAHAAEFRLGVHTVVVEELQVFPAGTIIRDLRVMGSGHEGRKSLAQLAAMSAREVRAFPVQRCNRASSCMECVALQDPYCAWEVRSARCSSGDWTKNMAGTFLQAVPTGTHKRCPSVGTAVGEKFGLAEEQGFSSLGKWSDYKLGQVVNIVDERMFLGKDSKVASGAERGAGGDGLGVKVLEPNQQQFSLEMLLMMVSAAAVAMLVVGFIIGYCCGRQCRKDDLPPGGLHLPYPDTEYEYFEQRGGLVRPIVPKGGNDSGIRPGDSGGIRPGGGSLLAGVQVGSGNGGIGGQMLVLGGGSPGAPLLPAQTANIGDGRHEEVTYAEPELIGSGVDGSGVGGLHALPAVGKEPLQKLAQQQQHQGPPPPIRFPGPPSSGSMTSGGGGVGDGQPSKPGPNQNSLEGPINYSSSLLNPANKFNTIHSSGNKRPLPSINQYESAAEAKLGSGKDPAFYARGRDNFNSYHMSTLGRGGGSNTSNSSRGGGGGIGGTFGLKDPLLGDRGPKLARGGSGLEGATTGGVGGSGRAGGGRGGVESNGSTDSSCGGGGGERMGQQVVDSAYGTTTRSAKVYL